MLQTSSTELLSPTLTLQEEIMSSLDANLHQELLHAKPTLAIQPLELVKSPTTVLAALMQIAMTEMDVPQTPAPTISVIIPLLTAFLLLQMEDALSTLPTLLPMQQDTASGSTLLLLLLILLMRMDSQLQLEHSLVIRLHVMQDNQAHTNASPQGTVLTHANVLQLPAPSLLATILSADQSDKVPLGPMETFSQTVE